MRKLKWLKNKKIEKEMYVIKKPYPNCAICQWFDKNETTMNYKCSAQGMKDTIGVYDNEVCKKLFKDIPVYYKGVKL